MGWILVINLDFGYKNGYYDGFKRLQNPTFIFRISILKGSAGVLAPHHRAAYGNLDVERHRIDSLFQAEH